MASSSQIRHSDGKIGGYLVGKRHSQGGIKAINADSGQPLELESDEVIITRKAVLSPEKSEFNGKMMTNLEILSIINERGGGVSLLEQGGKTGDSYRCKCGGHAYIYQGKAMIDREILSEMAAGGQTCGCQHHKNGGLLPSDLYPHHYPDQYKEGGTLSKRPKPEKTPPSDKGAFKGIDFDYANPFDLNRAIEALLDAHPDNNFDSDEKKFLKFYSGYGGLQKYGATGVGVLYEYFTPGEVARRMWGLAYHYGYTGGAILEPSCGVGEFFNHAPEQAEKTGYEINPYSVRITKILHPTAKVENKHFEELFIRNRDSIRTRVENLTKFDLVIGNPPYGNFQGLYAGMGEKSFTRASNYIDYFITRGLDLLTDKGLLIYIVGAETAAGGIPFLGQRPNPVKQDIAQKANLVDAYRLPNGIFDRTDVLTDIVVFQRK